MAADEVLVSPVEDGVATVTLNRPEKRNALSIAVRDLVSDALDALAADERVQCVVLTGAGDVFCAGFDLAEFRVEDPEFQKRLWASSDRFHRTVLCFPLPLVASINGPALAGGFDLAVMSDIRLASSTARFAHPEHAWSQVVYGPLEALVGGGVARDLCFTGRTIDAAEAFRLGLLSTVVEPGELAAATAATVSSITRAPRSVLMITKRKALARAGVDPASPTLDL
ncbi:MAG TPA: enoyl-CoA hydratase/isomerase family protein [Acidimicrobiia bacterium]